MNTKHVDTRFFSVSKDHILWNSRSGVANFGAVAKEHEDAEERSERKIEKEEEEMRGTHRVGLALWIVARRLTRVDLTSSFRFVPFHSIPFHTPTRTGVGRLEAKRNAPCDLSTTVSLSPSLHMLVERILFSSFPLTFYADCASPSSFT